MEPAQAELILHRLTRLRILWVVHVGFLLLYTLAGARLAPLWTTPQDHGTRLAVVATGLAVLSLALLRVRGAYGPRLIATWIAAEGPVICGLIHWIESDAPLSFVLGSIGTAVLLFAARPRVETVQSEVLQGA